MASGSVSISRVTNTRSSSRKATTTRMTPISRQVSALESMTAASTLELTSFRHKLPASRVMYITQNFKRDSVSALGITASTSESTSQAAKKQTAGSSHMVAESVGSSQTALLTKRNSSHFATQGAGKVSPVSVLSAGKTALLVTVTMVPSALSQPPMAEASVELEVSQDGRSGDSCTIPSAELASTTSAAASARQIARMDRLISASPAPSNPTAELQEPHSHAHLASR